MTDYHFLETAFGTSNISRAITREAEIAYREIRSRVGSLPFDENSFVAGYVANELERRKPKKLADSDEPAWIKAEDFYIETEDLYT